jgi:hypothetical protein
MGLIVTPGYVGSDLILDGSIVNADISATAGIVLSKLATSTSAQLASIISDETGTAGALVFGTSPSFTTDIRTPKVTTATAANLVLDTNLGTNSGSIVINQGVNGVISIAPNGTGLTYIGANSSNYFTLTGAASGTGPTVATAGATDANVNFNVQTKGTGSFVVASTTANTTSNISASGANANINLVLAGKGTGVVDLGAVTSVKITGGTTGQVLTTNGSGVLSWATASGGGGSMVYPASGIVPI